MGNINRFFVDPGTSTTHNTFLCANQGAPPLPPYPAGGSHWPVRRTSPGGPSPKGWGFAVRGHGRPPFLRHNGFHPPLIAPLRRLNREVVPMSHSLRRALSRGLLSLTLVVAISSLAAAQQPPEQAADMLINSARRAYNEKNFPFAAEKFKEFVAKFPGHKEADNARYGLALSLVDGPKREYAQALEALAP